MVWRAAESGNRGRAVDGPVRKTRSASGLGGVFELGPLNLQPRPGCAWRPAGHPARLRATCHRTGGVRHMLAALDLATGTMTHRIRERERWREFLALLNCSAPDGPARSRM